MVWRILTSRLMSLPTSERFSTKIRPHQYSWCYNQIIPLLLLQRYNLCGYVFYVRYAVQKKFSTWFGEFLLPDWCLYLHQKGFRLKSVLINILVATIKSDLYRFCRGIIYLAMFSMFAMRFKKNILHPLWQIYILPIDVFSFSRKVSAKTRHPQHSRCYNQITPLPLM